MSTTLRLAPAPARGGIVLLLTVSVVALLVVLATVFLSQVMGHATSGIHAKRRVITADLADHAFAHARAVLDEAATVGGAAEPESYTAGGTTWRYHSRRGVPIQGFYADGGGADVDRFEQIWYFVLDSSGPSLAAMVGGGGTAPIRNFGALAGWGLDIDRINQQLGVTDTLERYYGGDTLSDFRYFDAELQPVASASDAFWVGKYSVFIIDQHSLPRILPDLESPSHAITGPMRHQHVNYYARAWASVLGSWNQGNARELNPRSTRAAKWMGVGWTHPVPGGSWGGTQVHPWEDNPLLMMIGLFRGTGHFQKVAGRDNGFGRWDTTLGPVAGISGALLSPYQVYAGLNIGGTINRDELHRFAITTPGIVDPAMELDGCPWRHHILTLAPADVMRTVFGLSGQIQYMDLTRSDFGEVSLPSDMASSFEVLADEDFVGIEHQVAQDIDSGTPERDAYAAELNARWSWSGALGSVTNTALDDRLRFWQFEKLGSHPDLLFAPTGRFEPEMVLDVEGFVGSGSGGNWARLDLNAPYRGKMRGEWTLGGVTYDLPSYYPVDLHPYHLWAQGGTYVSDLLDDEGLPIAGGDTRNDAPESIYIDQGAPTLIADRASAGYFAFNTPDRTALASDDFGGFRYPVYSPPWRTGDQRRGDTNTDGVIDGSDITDKPYWTGMEGRECKLWPLWEWDYGTFGPMPSELLRIPDMNEWPMSDDPATNDERWQGLLPYAGYRENLIGDIAMAYIHAIAIAQINSAAEDAAGNRLPPSDWHHTPEALDLMARRLLIGATDGTLTITGSRTTGLSVAGGGTGSVTDVGLWLDSLRTDFINDPTDASDDVDDSPIYTATAEIVLNDFRMSLLGLAPEDFDGDGMTYGGAPPAASGTWQSMIELDVDVPFPSSAADRAFWGLPSNKWDLTGHDLDRDGTFEPFSATGRFDLYVQNTFRVLVRGRLEPGPKAINAGLYVPLNPVEGALQPVDVFAEGIYFVEDSDGNGVIDDDESHILHLRRRSPTDHR